MYKWYFHGVDGTNIVWHREQEKAFTFPSKEIVEREVKLLNSGHHLITPSEGGARLLFHNFRVEEGFRFRVEANDETVLTDSVSESSDCLGSA
jgi:hypothetical protein